MQTLAATAPLIRMIVACVHSRVKRFQFHVFFVLLIILIFTCDFVTRNISIMKRTFKNLIEIHRYHQSQDIFYRSLFLSLAFSLSLSLALFLFQQI